MPSSHRRYADWTIGRIRRDAALIGPATAALCDLILEHRPHPEQGFRSSLGILRLARAFGATRLEAAATRAIEIGALTCGSVRSILDHKLDRHAAHKPADGAPILHPNIRDSRSSDSTAILDDWGLEPLDAAAQLRATSSGALLFHPAAPIPTGRRK